MALLVKDRVQESSTTTGTGTFTLDGATSGFRTFSSAIGNGNTTYYAIVGGTEWEVGLGTVGAGTLARTTLIASSTGSAVSFSAGTKNVFCTYPADRAVTQDRVILNGATSGATTLNPVDAVTATITLPSATSTLISTSSSGQSIPKAALPTGSVLQVVSATTTTKTTTASASYVTTALTASITPTSATSKIAVFISTSAYLASSGGLIELTVYRNGANVTGNQLARVYGVSTAILVQVPIIWYDSPATTSATTYTLYIANNGAGSSVINQDGFPSTITLMEIAA